MAHAIEWQCEKDVEEELGEETKEFEMWWNVGKVSGSFPAEAFEQTENSKFHKFSHSTPSSNLDLLSAIGHLKVVYPQIEMKTKQMDIPPVERTYISRG